MFTKEDIRQIITQAGFKSDDYVLFTGNSLVVRGIRETSDDIDLGVTSEIFEELHLDEPITLAKWSGVRTFKMGDIEVFEYPDLAVVPSEIIDGLNVQTLDSIIAWKKEFGREKDIADINLITEYSK